MALFGGEKRRRKQQKSSQPAPYPPPTTNSSYSTNVPPLTSRRGWQTEVPQYPVQPPPGPLPQKSHSNLRGALASQAGKSVVQLTTKTSQYLDQNRKSCQVLNQGAALCDIISSRLDAIITSMDGENFSGTDQDLWLPDESESHSPTSLSPEAAYGRQPESQDFSSSTTNKKGSNHFSKVWLYTNSRLPPHLPPFKVYVADYLTVC